MEGRQPDSFRAPGLCSGRSGRLPTTVRGLYEVLVREGHLVALDLSVLLWVLVGASCLRA
jgi:hypothetical protein